MSGFKILLTITELSNLTGKTRPTIYRYQNAFLCNNLDHVPYSFIKLFELMIKDDVKKSEVIEFCHNQFNHYENVSEDYKAVMNLISENKNVLNFRKIKSYIEEALKNE